MTRDWRMTTAIACSVAALLPASPSNAKMKSPDGITPGIERPKNGDSVSWTSTVHTGNVLDTYQTTHMNAACKFFGYPKVLLSIPPKQGTFTFTKAPALPNVSKDSKCYNLKIPHVLGHYLPNPGFVGVDRVKIRSSLIGGGFAYVTIIIKVVK
ncbi:hypothetical protein [Mesorhizobium sp. M0768]|uniref:hypothetical protein n=1 Tax=Mesorhizobium sp. M0768 TaxID=2956996 RepID=UPI003334EAF5